mmetsp:Transcript_17088/g.37667  ORF Transcript_17088/g.37667 Transcript_17088/m.37667 type:complete len:353 (-) Transcript_17088:101-1159(-)
MLRRLINLLVRDAEGHRWLPGQQLGLRAAGLGRPGSALQLVHQVALHVLQGLRARVDGLLAHPEHQLPRLVALPSELLDLLLHLGRHLHLLLHEAVHAEAQVICPPRPGVAAARRADSAPEGRVSVRRGAVPVVEAQVRRVAVPVVETQVRLVHVLRLVRFVAHRRPRREGRLLRVDRLRRWRRRAVIHGARPPGDASPRLPHLPVARLPHLRARLAHRAVALRVAAAGLLAPRGALPGLAEIALALLLLPLALRRLLPLALLLLLVILLPALLGSLLRLLLLLASPLALLRRALRGLLPRLLLALALLLLALPPLRLLDLGCQLLLVLLLLPPPPLLLLVLAAPEDRTGDH